MDVARDPNVVFSDNRWWALINQLLDTYPRAGIEEDEFARGNVDQYRVVLDSNTTIMDPEVVDQTEKWVRKGGTFITYQQTGRHTSIVPDSWPIAKLTGYAVTGIDKLAPNGDGRPGRRLHLVEGQSVFNPGAPEWQYIKSGAGLSLKKVDPECEDLLQWDDGSIAAGMRHLGKGLVINLGVNSSAAVPQVLEYLHVQHVGATTGLHSIVTRHFISNNGLYDIYALWNSDDKPMTVTLTFNNGIRPDYCRDVNTGENMPIDFSDNTAKLLNVQLDNWQTRVFLSPRAQLANAPAEWLTLQRGWWKGTANTGAPIPPYKSKLAVNLTDDWAFKPIVTTLPVDGTVIGAPQEDASLADPKLDDSPWKRQQMGIFDIPDNPTANYGIFRKHFTVPAEWTKGKVSLNIGLDTPGGGNREYLDGQLTSANEVNQKWGDTLKPGSSHVLAIEIWGINPPVGTRTPIFLSYQPNPLSREPIKDNWAVAENVLKYSPTQSLPISMKLYGTFRTVVKIDASHAGQNVILHTSTDNNHQHTFYVNGRIVIGAGNWDVNITPWVKFGQDNELIVFCDNTTLQDASLDYYDKDVYP